MNDKSSTILATTVGAAIGAMAGYIFFTDRGRAFRRQLDQALGDIARELVHFRGTLHKAAGAANESWKILNDTFGENAPQPPRYADPHQTAPF